MIHQGSVSQLRSGQINRSMGYIVVGMCFYPRGLSKELRDFYSSHLAPDKELFKEWQGYEKKFGHEQAFGLANYEARFQLDDRARYHLREFSLKPSVYFICQCSVGERCHREMLMLYMREKLGSEVDRIYNEYPVFLERIAQWNFGEH